jgi:hypothetical protein
MAVTTTVAVGALVGTLYNRWVSKTAYAEVAKRLGILLASGMIVGESLFGVFSAAVIVASNDGDVFAMVGDGWPAMIAAVVAFIAINFGLYAWTKARAAKV